MKVVQHSQAFSELAGLTKPMMAVINFVCQVGLSASSSVCSYIKRGVSHVTHPTQQDPCGRHQLQPETTSDDD